MEIKKIVKFLFVILLFIVLIYNTHSCLRDYPKNEVSYKDSLLITNTLYKIARGDVDLNWQKIFPDLDLDSSYFRFQIENIYQSPDNLKALVFITYNYKRKMFENSPFDTNIYVAGWDIVLLRDTKYEPWELYILGYYVSSGWSEREDVRINMEKYFRYGLKSQGVHGHSDKYTFEEILEKEGYILDSNNQIVINPKYTKNERKSLSIKFPIQEYIIQFENKYGLDDEEFWTESFIWKKGIRLPDLYIFQTESHIIMEGYILNYNIQYPDSIIQMYKEK